MNYWNAIIAGFLGLIVGLVLPDIHLLTGLTIGNLTGYLLILTYGFVLSTVFFLLAYYKQEERYRLFTIGLSLAVATTLCFNIFTPTWLMHTIIIAERAGTFAPIYTVLWILISIIGCLSFAFALIRYEMDFGLVVAGLSIAFMLSSTRVGTAFWSPLLALIFLSLIAWYLASVPITKRVWKRKRGMDR